MKTFFSMVTFAACVVLLSNNSWAQDTDLSNLDTDDNGSVSLAEFEKYASGKLPGFDQLTKFARKVDADGDGKISEGEFADRHNVLQKLVSSGGSESEDDDSKPAKSDTAGKKEVQKTFAQIKKFVDGDKWKKAADLMTAKAQDEFVVEQVISAIGLVEMPMTMPIPQLEEAIENIEEAIEKHDLDKLDIDVSQMFRVKMDVDGLDDEEDKDEDDQAKEPHQKSMEDARKKVLEAVGKLNNRWDVVKDLWNAKKSSPFGISPITGKVEKVEMDGDVAYLEVHVVPSNSDDQGGMMLQMVSPPTIIRMKQAEGAWKLDGRDEARTMKAVKEFMKENRGRFGAPQQRNDF